MKQLLFSGTLFEKRCQMWDDRGTIIIKINKSGISGGYEVFENIRNRIDDIDKDGVDTFYCPIIPSNVPNIGFVTRYHDTHKYPIIANYLTNIWEDYCRNSQ